MGHPGRGIPTSSIQHPAVHQLWDPDPQGAEFEVYSGDAEGCPDAQVGFWRRRLKGEKLSPEVG